MPALWRDRLLLIILVLLPWQARLILKYATLAGVPWEQGTLSIFALEPALWLAIACHLLSILGKKTEVPRLPLWFKLAALLPACALVSALWAPDATAALLSSLRLGEAWALAYLLCASNLTLASALAAFAAGTVLTSALGLWQFFTQTSFASTWLGMAAHFPQSAGVVVIETASGRFLRAYGSLPHPNILGGYVAAGLVACLSLAARPSRFRTAALAAAPVLGAGLVASFSRSAWVAAAFALAACACAPALGAAGPALRRTMRAWMPAWCAILGGAAVVAAFAWPLLSARASFQGRLETRSVNERVSSFKEGWGVFLHSGAAGAGAGNALPAMFSLFGVPEDPYTVQPPHFVPLLVADELGALGLAALLACAGLWCLAAFRLIRRASSPAVAAAAALPLAVLIVGGFDHYPFDLFAGTMLAGACFGCFLKAGTEKPVS